MTDNPLARRRNADAETPSTGRTYADIAIGESIPYNTKDRSYLLVKTDAGFSADLAAMYNAARQRDDIEWAPTPGGLQCRTPAPYIAKRLNDDKRRFDEETRKAKHRAEFPIAGEAA